ncbi:MAG: hypothetical protein JWO53_35 [Chlamydiia bacterium]|nr:hypothetical protein [Chlamydiia bacterium]
MSSEKHSFYECFDELKRKKSNHGTQVDRPKRRNKAAEKIKIGIGIKTNKSNDNMTLQLLKPRAYDSDKEHHHVDPKK